MKKQNEKLPPSDVRVSLAPQPTDGRAERMAVLRKGLGLGLDSKEKEEAVFRAMFEEMAQTSQFPRRGAQLQVTVEEPIDTEAQWLEKEMEDIQKELGSPFPDVVIRALISSQSDPEDDEQLQFYVLKHRAHEMDHAAQWSFSPQKMLEPLVRDEDKPPSKTRGISEEEAIDKAGYGGADEP